MKLNLKKEDIQALISSRRYLLFAGLMVLIGVAIIVFGVIFQFSGLVELIAAKNQAEDTNRLLQNKIKSLEEVDYLAEFSKSPQVDLALPAEKPLLQLISGVNNVAQQAGVTLSDVTTSPGKLATQSAGVNLDGTAVDSSQTQTIQELSDDTKLKVNGVNVLTIGLKARGSLSQVNNFLDMIEKITPITQATRMKLLLVPAEQIPTEATASASLNDFYEAELELSTYYFSQPIAVTVDSPLPTIGGKDRAFLDSLASFQFPDYQKQQEIQGGGSTDLFGTQ